jgi:hypothetical protein
MHLRWRRGSLNDVPLSFQSKEKLTVGGSVVVTTVRPVIVLSASSTFVPAHIFMIRFFYSLSTLFTTTTTTTITEEYSAPP